VVVALDLVGLVPWVALFVFGAWLVATGRRPISWLPEGIREGWRLRLYGLVCCAFGAFFLYRISLGGFSTEGIFFSYVALGVGLLTAWRRAQSRA
jgi:O-antigen ligase